MGFFERIRAGLAKTRRLLIDDLGQLFRLGRKVDAELLGEIEAQLIHADLGPKLSTELVNALRESYEKKEIESSGEILSFLQASLSKSLSNATPELTRNPDGPTVIVLVGVNGTGKTTTTAKLAHYLSNQGHSVLLAAADTFRAAAGEQLDIWAKRIEVDIVRHPDGSDPAAVVFDACQSGLVKGVDYILVDTAGRLHTKVNLMQQLGKITRVAGKKIPGAPHEVLLILDATTGQNALSQASLFAQGVGITGLILTKLDGSAKGGVAVAINRQTGLPIRFIGVGEGIEDLVPFQADEFAKALFGEAPEGEKVSPTP
jgi:fused signal recognition particle receptor